MHYSTHSLAASVANVTTLTYPSINDQLIVHTPLVRSSKTKPHQFSYTQFTRWSWLDELARRADFT